MKKQIISLIFSTAFCLTSSVFAMDVEHETDVKDDVAPTARSLFKNPGKKYILTIEAVQSLLTHAPFYKDETNVFGARGEFVLCADDIGAREFALIPCSKNALETPKLPEFFERDAEIECEWEQSGWNLTGAFIVRFQGDARSKGQKNLKCMQYYNLFSSPLEKSVQIYSYELQPILFKNIKDTYKITVLDFQNILERAMFEGEKTKPLDRKGTFTLYACTPEERKFSITPLSKDAREKEKKLPEFFNRKAVIEIKWSERLLEGCFWAALRGDARSINQKKLYGKDYSALFPNAEEQSIEYYAYGIKPLNKE